MGSLPPDEPRRLFPSRWPTQTTSTPLSIIDATCARFANTGAIWFFDAPLTGPVDAGFIDHLRSSLICALDLFPHWAGQLHWAQYRRDGRHTERFGRPVVTYGGEQDPGVGWAVKQHDFPTESVIPGAEYRVQGLWSGDAFPQEDLMPKGNLALHDLKECEGLPGVMVQVNLFTCGGYAVGIKIAHPLADAQSLMVFMQHWAANCRCELGSSKAAIFGTPVFDPSQLDAKAAGDIDAAEPDERIVVKARALPLHRFSWWDTDAPGYSPYLVSTTKNNIPPPEILAESKVSPTTTGPWKTWDLDRPVSWVLLHFSGKEMTSLRDLARRDLPGDSKDSNVYISKTDALLAHLFKLITKSRSYVQSSDDEVFMNVTLDARRRVAPPLPEAFIGSLPFMTHIKSTSYTVSNSSIGTIALQLRRTMQTFTPDVMAAMLHDMAFEVSPQRLWFGFLGCLHVLVTSWQRTRLYEVDFEGTGVRPKYVHAVMSKCDGLVMVNDPVVEDGGCDVAVYLDTEAMGRFLEEFQGAKTAFQ